MHGQHRGPQQHPARRDHGFSPCPRTFPLPTHRPRPQLQTRPPCRAGFAFLHPEKQPRPRCSPSAGLCQGETEARPLSSLGGPTQPLPSILRRPGAHPGITPTCPARPHPATGVNPGCRGAGVPGQGSARRLQPLARRRMAPLQPVLFIPSGVSWIQRLLAQPREGPALPGRL